MKTLGGTMRTLIKGLAFLAIAALMTVTVKTSTYAADAITVKGSDTLVKLAQRWAETYMKKNKGVRIQVSGGGSGVGIAALMNGTVDIADASRPMKKKEKAKMKAAGEHLVEITVAMDGITVYLNKSNPVESLSLAKLKDIYQSTITNWKEVGGKDQKIVLYGRENSSGTYGVFKKIVLLKQDYSKDVQTLPGTAAIVNAVAKDQGGIGYGGAAYASGVKKVKLSKGGTAYAPEASYVKSGKYPLARPLFMYTTKKIIDQKPFIKAYMRWCLSPEGQKLTTKAGYFPK